MSLVSRLLFTLAVIAIIATLTPPPARAADDSASSTPKSTTQSARAILTTRPVIEPVIPPAILKPGPVVMHLPGIGGLLSPDRRLLLGLKDGGISIPICAYDWTDNNSGLNALHAYDRNQQEAARISSIIVKHLTLDPNSAMNITAHSGGCGLAIWALEKLPPQMMVDTVILMAPALSPNYDLTAALKHVRGHVYAFTSMRDIIVLNTGTKLLGTIDGVKSEAAGYSGFVAPAGADPSQYKKLVPRPYDADWEKLDNYGDHIGAMSRPFAAEVLAPLLTPKQLAATTQPAARASE